MSAVTVTLCPMATFAVTMVHGPDWDYLSPAAGQHILFWSRGALHAFAARFGFNSVGYFPAAGFRCVILSDRPADELAGIMAGAEQRLWTGSLLGTASGDWVLARPGDGVGLVAEAVDRTSGGQPCAC